MANRENFYCKFVLDHPKLCFALTLGCHFLTIFLTVLLRASGYDILPLDISQVPMQLDTKDIKLQGDAWKFVAADPRVTWNFASPVDEKETLRSSRFDILEMYYQADQQSSNGNVITAERLKKIRDFEEKLYNNSVYQKELCLLQDKMCQKPFSIIQLFDGTYKHVHPVLYDPDFKNIALVIYQAHLLMPTIRYHFSKDVKITSTTVTSYALRSMFFAGNPFKDFSSTHDRQNEQLEKCRELAYKAFGEILADAFKNGIGDLKIHYLMNTLMMGSIQRQVVWDLLLVVGSFVFIFVFMIMQTQSLWITGWSILSIFCSFFGANMIYRIVLDYRYIGIFHVLTVFIIAGIGADDVFVFYDTWRSSKEKGFVTLLQRFSYTYNHAAKAMLTTSVTTFVAFVTNYFSPLLAVSSFGVFSALIVMVNYLSIIVFFPNVLVTYELYWKDWKWPCFRCYSRRVLPCENKEQETEEEAFEDPSQSVAKFIGETFYYRVVGHRIVRWVVVVIAIAIIAVSMAFTVKLVPDEDQIDIMGPGTNWYDAKRLRDNSFNPSEEDKYFKVYVAWGLQNQDRSTCHFTDYKCQGKTVFDKGFDITIPPCQTALLSFCKELKNLPENKLQELNIRRNQITGIPTVNCFIEDMGTYFKQESNKVQYPNGTDFRLPLSSNKVQTLMKYNPKLYNMTTVSDEYYRYFEVAIAHWMTRGNVSYSNKDFDTYKKLIGGTLDETLKPSNIFQGGKYGNQMLYAAVTIETNLTISSLGYVTGNKIIESWQKFINIKMKDFPLSCQNAFPTTPENVNPWHWIKVQEVLVVNAVRGICLGLALTFPILVLMIGNWIIALLCMLSISCTTLGVIGIIPMSGWKLGVLESLNLTLVVGLAVDYVVHLAEGYLTCPEASRHARVKHTLVHVGISVLSGACTTLGAAVFMFGAKILFFFQFGIFIFCTIAFSLLFALFFFITLLDFFGPQGEAGSMKLICRRVRNKIRGKKSNDVDCRICDGKGFHSVQPPEEELPAKSGSSNEEHI